MAEEYSDVTLRVAIATAVCASIVTVIYVVAEVEPAPVVELFLATGPLIAVILWLQKDAARTRVAAVLDLGLFVWFAWPIVIPWYVFKTRGRSGWRLLAILIALILSAFVTGVIAFLAVHGTASTE